MPAHGGGSNNVNKKGKGGAAPAASSARPFTPPVIYRGGNVTTGRIPSPVETTNRPSRRG